MSRLHPDIVLRKEFDGSGILLNTRTGAIFTDRKSTRLNSSHVT